VKLLPTRLPDVIEIEPVRHGDDRGWFSETFKTAVFAEAGLDVDFVQDNESFSAVSGTLRGLHYQVAPHAQAKLMRVLSGSILDVAVDIRRGSPTFGEYVAVMLSADVGNQLFVPVGFAHGFCTLEPDTRVAYKVSGNYSPDCERSISWDDSDIAIDWPDVASAHTLSAKDAVSPRLADQPDVYEVSS
jgi:dTDP-4-dehydrorhamnose 3,5-epimerase